MNNKNFEEIMDTFHDANNLLEMCYGYTQSDTPVMNSLTESLYLIKLKYDSIYLKLSAIDKVE